MCLQIGFITILVRSFEYIFFTDYNMSIYNGQFTCRSGFIHTLFAVVLNREGSGYFIFNNKQSKFP